MLLYQLLKDQPAQIFSAQYPGWVHPPFDEITVVDSGTEAPYLYLAFAGAYGILLAPQPTVPTTMQLVWTDPLPTRVAGANLHTVTIDGSGIELMTTRRSRLEVQGMDGNPLTDMQWEVREYPTGLWSSLRPRVRGHERIQGVVDITAF